MDEEIQEPERDVDKDFLISVEACYNIAGRGTVFTGTIDQGQVKIGQDVELVGYGKRLKTTITGVETFKKSMDKA